MTQLTTSEKIVIYPDSDGQPMADNTKQFRWILVIQQNIDWLFANDPDVFVAGDLLWYPVEGNNKLRLAPDVMVAFGRPKGDRGSYQQWKGEKPIADVKWRFKWLGLYAFVHPKTGETFWWILPYANTQLFNQVLADFACEFDL